MTPTFRSVRVCKVNLATLEVATIDLALGTLGVAWLCLPETSTTNVCKFLDGADSTRADIVNYDIHFVTDDALNAGLFQKSKLQTLKKMAKCCWADVQSNERAYAEWKYLLDVRLVRDETGRGRLALVSKH